MSLRRGGTDGLDHDEESIAGQGQVDLETLVVFLKDEGVLGLILAQHVLPDPIRAMGVVEGRVEESRSVGRPGSAVVGACNFVGQILACGEISEAQSECLVPRVVHGVGESGLVEADRDLADVAKASMVGELVLVEDHLGVSDRSSGASARTVGTACPLRSGGRTTTHRFGPGPTGPFPAPWPGSH